MIKSLIKLESDTLEIDEDELMMDSANLFASNQSLLNSEFIANRVLGIRNALFGTNPKKLNNAIVISCNR